MVQWPNEYNTLPGQMPPTPKTSWAAMKEKLEIFLAIAKAIGIVGGVLWWAFNEHTELKELVVLAKRLEENQQRMERKQIVQDENIKRVCYRFKVQGCEIK